MCELVNFLDFSERWNLQSPLPHWDEGTAEQWGGWLGWLCLLFL